MNNAVFRTIATTMIDRLEVRQPTETHTPKSENFGQLICSRLANVAYYTDKCPVQFWIWPVDNSKNKLLEVYLFKWSLHPPGPQSPPPQGPQSPLGFARNFFSSSLKARISVKIYKFLQNLAKFLFLEILVSAKNLIFAKVF